MSSSKYFAFVFWVVWSAFKPHIFVQIGKLFPLSLNLFAVRKVFKAAQTTDAHLLKQKQEGIKSFTLNLSKVIHTYIFLNKRSSCFAFHAIYFNGIYVFLSITISYSFFHFLRALITDGSSEP